MEVEEQHGNETTTKNPENPAFWREGIQQCLQEMGVVVKTCCTGIHLEVPDHVEQDKTHHGDARDSHDVLLAHRCGIEIEEKWALLTLVGSGAGDRAPVRCNYLCHVNNVSLRAGQAGCATALETVPRETPVTTT